MKGVFTFPSVAAKPQKGSNNPMYLDDIIDSITFDAYPFFSPRKGIRSTFDGRVTTEGDSLIVSVDVPGVKKDGLEVTLELTSHIKIVAERADTGAKSTWHYNVPKAYDRESGVAELTDGVLTIRFSKAEQEKPRKLLLK